MSSHSAQFALPLVLLGAAALGGEDRPRRPDAVIDLRTQAGVELVRGLWRYRDATVVEVDHRLPGPDLKPTGAPNRTHDIQPQAGAIDFDDRDWNVIAPGALESRQSGGRLCFGWYRIRITLPETVGQLPVAGAAAVLELVVDDYAEVWVDGRLPFVVGSSGGQLVAGWNAANRVLLTRDAKPGQSFQLAIFAANGPLSKPPENYVWIRSATLDLYAPGTMPESEEVVLTVDRRDAALDVLLGDRPRLERLASGFSFAEGPLWSPEGALFFSDPNDNTIYRWTPESGALPYRLKSGYTGFDIGRYRQPGSNGLTLDAEGRLTICEHGNRRVTRLERNGIITVLADRFEGKRLNSPNDLVYRSGGALYFTDPPFGLPGSHDDPTRELPPAVYCLGDGRLRQVSTELAGPNGLAFSPDERHLYVTNWDLQRKVVVRHEARPDGTLGPGQVFFDMTGAPGEEALDGVKVDERGNLYVSGPGGLWIIAPDGRHLGTLRGPELAANFAFGGADSRTLFWAARSGLYRLRLAVPGRHPANAKRGGVTLR